MRDTVVAGIILVLLVSLFFWNSYVMETKTRLIMSHVTKLVDNPQTINLETAGKLKKKWNKEKKILFYLAEHGTVKDIDKCMDMFYERVKENNREYAIHCLKEARHHLKDLSEREKIRLDNIF